jgi:predicted lipoprotein
MANRLRLGIQQRTAAAAASTLGLALLLGAVGCAEVPGIYVYEPAGASARSAAPFDAVSYVDGIWDSQVLPTAQDRATAASVLFPAIAADPNAAGEQYGRRAGTGAPFAFLVTGTGQVTAVDVGKPTGPVTVQVDDQAVTIATGPVIAGTALRDSLDFIDFSQFTNQLDYADVATQLNERVKRDVIGNVDKAELVGKQVTFTGAFSQLAPGAPVMIVPTELQVVG